MKEYAYHYYLQQEEQASTIRHYLLHCKALLEHVVHHSTALHEQDRNAITNGTKNFYALSSNDFLELALLSCLLAKQK